MSTGHVDSVIDSYQILRVKFLDIPRCFLYIKTNLLWVYEHVRQGD